MLVSLHLQPIGLPIKHTFCRLENFTKLTSLKFTQHLRSAHTSATEIQLLQQLTNLKKLTVLDFDGISHCLSKLTQLQTLDLCLGSQANYFCDLSTLICVQHIRIVCHCTSPLTKVILPTGANVKLVSLRLVSQDMLDLSALVHLAAATQLTCLELHKVALLNDKDWPKSLPSLCQLCNTFLAYPPPATWTMYSGLRVLTLDSIQLDRLPDWFSGLTMITALTLAFAKLHDFPLCIMHLSQLHRLDMSNIYPPLRMPACIVNFAKWDHLSKLNFGSCIGVLRDAQSQQHLKMLMQALGHRGSVLDMQQL